MRKNRPYKKKKTKSPLLSAAVLLAELLLVAFLLLLRNGERTSVPAAVQPGSDVGMTAEDPVNGGNPDSSVLENVGKESADPTASDSSDSEIWEAETDRSPDAEGGAPVQQNTGTPNLMDSRAERSDYNDETWHLASDMVYTYRYQQEQGSAAIAQLIEELKGADPDLGSLWEKVMAFWSEVNTEGYVRSDLPDGLPRDDSLCIVTLGFQLLPDGEMAPELLARCRKALECMQQYPEAMLLLTGGGTAARGNPATEADKMAEWFLQQGIPRERMIIENTSLTTTQNAKNSVRILAEQYPQIHTLAIVSSDYHIRLGSLLFQSAAYLREYEEGGWTAEVAGNASFPTEGDSIYDTVAMQAQDLWSLMDPTY